jgi:hypothetical protein
VSFDQHHPAPRRRLTLLGSRDASPHPVVAHDHTAVRDSSDHPPVEPGDLIYSPLMW